MLDYVWMVIYTYSSMMLHRHHNRHPINPSNDKTCLSYNLLTPQMVPARRLLLGSGVARSHLLPWLSPSLLTGELPTLMPMVMMMIMVVMMVMISICSCARINHFTIILYSEGIRHKYLVVMIIIMNSPSLHIIITTTIIINIIIIVFNVHTNPTHPSHSFHTGVLDEAAVCLPLRSVRRWHLDRYERGL